METYDSLFYRVRGVTSKNPGKIYGWPSIRYPWCTGELKLKALKKIKGINYIGYAADEIRSERKIKIQEYLKTGDSKKIYPLVDFNITEQEAMKWCKENDLLSPIYTNETTRGGCWFCHSQRIDDLRNLRKNYPKYWKLMLGWDKDSTTLWGINKTLHDYERRFTLEDLGQVPTDRTFRWKMIG